MRWLPVLLLAVGCSSPESAGLPPLPAFVDDCGEAANDAVEKAAGIEAVDGQRYDDVSLCADDVDVYRIDVPAGSWASVEIAIDGSGQQGTDLDLYELDDAGDEVWQSAFDQDYERLAWYNPGDEPVIRWLEVRGWRGAEADYSVIVRVSAFHEGMECSAFYDDLGESGPCNAIMQFPETAGAAAGYFVQHPPFYSNLRREVIYLVRYAAFETARAFPDTNPIALMDMSEREGDTPGTAEGRLRHPQGTHVRGNDIDVAYYQTGDDNGGRAVCPRNDGYFCTGEPTLLDARRTAFFLSRLLEHPRTRVIGVDPEVAEDVQPAAWDLVDEGILDERGAQRVNGRKLAYGDGWPFHHHHLHYSWQWEQGHEFRGEVPDGCLLGPALDPR